MNLFGSRSGKARSQRDVLMICLVTILALAPLWFIVRSRQPAPQSGYTVNPDSPWRVSDNSAREPRIALSPSGKFLAGVCPSSPASGGAAPAGAAPPQGSDLVIWRVSDRAELARVRLDNESTSSIQWSGNETFVATVGRFAQVYEWRSGALVNAAVSRMIGGSAGSTDLDVDTTWINLDSDLKLQSITDGGMQAFRISTGAAIPVRWRWRQDSGASVPHWRLALQPVSPGGPLRAAVVQLEPTPIPDPTPVSTPTATPRPTPTPTVEQQAFIEKERRLDEEVTEIVNRLMADDGPTGAEAQQLEERAKAINAELKAERARLFPPSALPTPRPTPPPAKTWVTVSLWDLSSGTTLWKKRFFHGSNPGYNNIYPSWSPDGKVLALLGTPRTSRTANSTSEGNRGLEFLSASNGQLLASTTPGESVPWIQEDDVLWLSPAQLVFKDRDERSRSLLNIIDTGTGKTLRKLPLAQVQPISDIVSADSTGMMWALASSSQGWQVFSANELQSGSAAQRIGPSQ
jgi:hypothetical protein